MINMKLLAGEARDKGYDKDPRTQEEVRSVLRDAMLKDARKGAPTPADLSADEVRAYYDAHRADFRDPERRRVSVIVLASEPAANAVLDQAKHGLSAADWGALVRSKSIDPSAKVNGSRAASGKWMADDIENELLTLADPDAHSCTR